MYFIARPTLSKLLIRISLPLEYIRLIAFYQRKHGIA